MWTRCSEKGRKKKGYLINNNKKINLLYNYQNNFNSIELMKEIFLQILSKKRRNDLHSHFYVTVFNPTES